MILSSGFLMIEPKNGTQNKTPVVDTYTRKAAWLVHNAKVIDHFMGVHRCVCGARSDSADRWWNGRNTNSLAAHYMALHRDEVPLEELQKLDKEVSEEVEPSFKDLWGYEMPKKPTPIKKKRYTVLGYIRDLFVGP